MNYLSSRKRLFFGKLFFLQALSFLALISKAQAGGPGQSTPQSTINKPAVSVVDTLNWEKWSQPYWLNGSICRESTANTICLTPQQAQTLRWSIPSNQQFNQLEATRK
ncbi:MAG TPA: hypothetical protein DD379_05565 [Cyanobacteria bacterium UBA11162]|nr:hypothetical protein [Cyanobacteria bacterium UBA11162]